MLTELSIRDFAIIDSLTMSVGPGFAVLTGETGAGKSIILDAMTLVLGGRSDTTMVRAGAEQAYVEAVFRLTPALQASLRPMLEQEGLDEEDSETLVLAREVRANGRSFARVNGRAVTLNLLREIADPLVDIHGQGVHLSLLKPSSHLKLLDSYGGLEQQRRQLAAEVDRLRAVQGELNALQRDARLIAQRADMLAFQVEEISAAALNEGEEEVLREERTRLANAEQLKRLAAEALNSLLGLGDDTPAVLDLLGETERALGHLARVDESQAALLQDLQGLSFQLNEVAAQVQDYLEALDFDAQRLDEVEERLELISTLKRKYGDTITDVLATGLAAEAELAQISNSEERLARLEDEQQHLLELIGRLGEALSVERQKAGLKLAAAIEKELAELRMEGARFAVGFTREPAEGGAYTQEGRVAFDRSGIDRAEFLIAANPGEPLKPMARVASGGETARLMLALKSALAAVDATPTLIFDEIDQGIGGRVGDIVGRKLWGLTAVGGHQVIIVTHLPQLAGYGDAHFQISKQVSDGRTTTQVQPLDGAGRVGELAAMLGTGQDTAVDGARAILDRVVAVKREMAARQPS